MRKIQNTSFRSESNGSSSTRTASERRKPEPEPVAHYRSELRKRYGIGVPEIEIEAFAAVYTAAGPYANQIEAMLTAVRARVRDEQRRRVRREGCRQ